jgi:putative membrane protein
MLTHPHYCAALAASLGLSTLALAATDASPQEQDFVNQASHINTAEIKLGTLAEKVSANSDVRDFAKLMVKDHEKLNKELKEAAEKENANLPSDLDQEHMDLYDKLSKLSGADFDKQYMSAMIKGHKKAIDTFESEAKDHSQTPVEIFAETTIPTLRMHAEMARTTGKEVGAPPDEEGTAQIPDQPAAGK